MDTTPSESELATGSTSWNEHIQTVLSETAGVMLRSDSDNFIINMRECLSLLCKDIPFDRMIFWRNVVVDDEVCFTVIHQWERTSELHQSDIENLPYNLLFPGWFDRFRSGMIMNGPIKELDGVNKELILNKYSTKSILMIPIIIGEEFWGAVSIDDCFNERVFPKADEKLLYSVAMMMDSAVIRLEKEKLWKENLYYKEKLLATVNSVSAILLTANVKNFESDLLKCMEMIARTIDVDILRLWHNFEGENGKPYCKKLYAWQATPSPASEPEAPRSYYEQFPGHYKKLIKGETVNVITKEMENLVERDYYQGVGIKSLLIVPIVLGGEFWGFIGFGDMRKNRAFIRDEEEVLKSASMMIAAALTRNQLTVELLDSQEEALSLAQSKSDFLANMSHEIRSPLNAIIGMTSIGMNAEDPEKKQYALSRIEDTSTHLLGVINDVLDISKMEANKFEMHPVTFRLDDLTKRILDVVRFQAKKKNQKLIDEMSPKLPQILVCDDHRLMQVMLNLLSNAMKFTPEGGAITVRGDLISEDDGVCLVRIAVCDTGIGMTKEQCDRLFNAYAQADASTSREYGGTGLGLMICKNIIEKMGGRIWVQSEFGVGSEFIFEIQTVRGSELPGDEETSQIETQAVFDDKVILIAEDVDINREIVDALLEPTKVQIEFAENGKIAFEMFAQNPLRYDLIFMDVKMPVMDGYEATKAIRNLGTKAAKTIPIIAMTANVFQEDIDKCIEAGMNSHLGKPLNYNEIIEQMQKYL